MSATGTRERVNRHANSNSTAPAAPWLDEGYTKKYVWWSARAQIGIAEWVRSNVNRDSSERKPFEWCSPSSDDIYFGFHRLVTSYPFLASGRDLTSLRGNITGADQQEFYQKYQSPDWGDLNLKRLRASLRRNKWCPGKLRTVKLPNGRVLHIPNLEDRVVERAIVQVLAPIYEPQFHPRSFGFRIGRTLAQAFNELQYQTRKLNRWVIGKLDLSKAFDRVPHERLMEILRLWIKDEKFLELVSRIVNRPGWLNLNNKSNIGLPQGGPLSPMLFNIYVNHIFDQVVARNHPDICFLRWADDILFICRDSDQLVRHRKAAENMLDGAGLKVNQEKTYGSDSMADLNAGESMEYLGFNLHRQNENVEFSLQDSAYARLMGQLNQDLLGQRPNVSELGYRKFLLDQTVFTLGSWLEAYAGAISSADWPTVRRGIKSLFLGDIVTFTPSTNISRYPGISPSSHTLNALYDRACSHWVNTSTTTPKIPFIKRDANSKTFKWSRSPALLADGADLVPAPMAFVVAYGTRKPGPDEVEWRTHFCDVPNHAQDLNGGACLDN